MRQDVSLSNYLMPGYFGMIVAERSRYSSGSFSDNLQFPFDNELKAAVVQELLQFGALKELERLPPCLEHVPEIGSIFPFRLHTGL